MKKLIFIISAVLSCIGIQAQLPLLTPGKIAGQDMTCKALESTLLVTKTNYRLKDKADGKFYGRDGNPDFGFGYGVAVKTEDGVMALSSCLMPWTDDNNFQKISDKYDAVLSSVEICGLGNKDFTPIEKPALLDGIYQIIDPQSKGGLTIGTQNGEVNGWCVWVTAQSNGNNSSLSDLKCQANTKTIEIGDTTKSVDAGNPPSGCEVLGGIYVVPEYIEGGIIRFNIMGLLDKTFDKWNIILPFKSGRIEKSKDVLTNQSQDSEINITPVEEKKPAAEESAKDSKKNKKKNKKGK